MICFEMFNMYYNDGPVNSAIRRVFFMDMANSIHVCDDLVYQWINSLPSGASPTVIINSLVSGTSLVGCWIENHPQGITGLREFEDNCKFVVVGDDNLFTITDSAAEFMNYYTVEKTMAGYGLKYSDESKGDIVVPYKDLSEVNFLKRSFRYEPLVGRYVAPLQLESIVEMLYWTKRGAESQSITRSNVDNALHELSLHCEEDFHKWARLVVDGAREILNYYPPVTSRKALLFKVCKREYTW